ncbi:response regulator transcription factor [Nocardioides sp.]|uniref:response regulator transcription factor n=1 Tax=Nocardioides sp. TaxID=35761 RepID=UPI00286A21F8|nr:response regulator transcription factor [Nocardioides sp.]
MRILMVEDDQHVAAAVKRGLEAEGYVVDVAHDGSEGLWLATEGAYDLVVLDSMLPGENGESICRRLRQDRDWTPILMLTARVGTEPEVAALDAGADDFLAKPFAYQVLLARIRALLRRGRQERPVVLEAGDLRLDPASHEVWRGTSSVDLTPRQFALLECLMRQPGEVLSKTEIKDRLFDFAYDGDLNVIEVHVRQLRRRIDEPFGRSSILTVRGVGYRLDPAG